MPLQPKVCDWPGSLARMGGDRALLNQLVEFFREDSQDYLGRLRTAADADDAAAVRLAAHSLNGLVANFGAEAASQAAWRVEELALIGDLKKVHAAVNLLEDEIDRLKATLSLECGADQGQGAPDRPAVPHGKHGC